MGRILKRWSSMTGLSLENPNNWGKIWRSTASGSGVEVDEFSALFNIDVFTCVRIISETIAQLPFPVYKRLDGGGKERAPNHPLYDVLGSNANEEMTAFTLKETLQGHLLTWGNAYAYIERNDIGDCIGLWPLLPDRTHPFRINNELFYYTRIKKLPTADPGDSRVFPAKDVFHIPGMGYDGLVGYSVIGHLRESIGLGVAQEQFAARFYSNNTVPPVALVLPKGHLKEEDKDRILASWNEEHRGVNKQWKTAILEEGMDIKTIGLPLQDAEFLHTRAFTRTQILGFFRVPPHMVGDTEKTTSYGQGVEQQQIAFTMFTIAPWAVRWEQIVDKKLMLRPRDDRYFAEFLVDGLQRSDIKTRFDAYQAAWGKWMTTDEIRARENMNAYVAPDDPNDAGKTLFVPLALAPAEKIIDGTASPKSNPLALPSGPAPTDPVDDPALVVASIRRTIATAQRFIFLDIAERVIRREQTDIGKALAKRNAAEVIDGLDDDHRDYVQKQMLPALRSYAAVVCADVEREIGRATLIPESFIENYAESYARRHATAVLGDARQLIGDPNRDAALAAWSKRAAWIADREVIQAGNAFARAAYRQAGIPELEWSSGDDCAECTRLHGQKIAIDGVFIRRGETNDDRFIPVAGLGHPPLCEGCACVVVAAGSSPVRAIAVIEPPREDAVLRALEALVANKPPARDVVVQVVDSDGAPRESDPEMSPAMIELMSKITTLVTAMAERSNRQTEPTQIVLKMDPIQIPPTVVNVTPQLEMPPMNVTVEMPQRPGMKIVYDPTGRIVGTEPTE
jgi:HK97 family phage portal protein